MSESEGTNQDPAPSEGRQDVLADEVHHRVQNTLAVVLAMARLTARSVTTIEAFQVAFGDRVQAMARTNALLLRGRANAVSVRQALEVELELHTGEDSRVALDCDAMTISADAALSLSLIIHELATNASRFGALSTPGGRLSVICETGPVGGVLRWRETTDGQETSLPLPGGGDLLIERLARNLGGHAETRLHPEGLEATITFRLANAG